MNKQQNDGLIRNDRQNEFLSQQLVELMGGQIGPTERWHELAGSTFIILIQLNMIDGFMLYFKCNELSFYNYITIVNLVAL